MRIKRSVLAPVAVVSLAMLTGGWLLQRGVRQEQNVYLQVRLLQEVVSHIADKYVREIPATQLYHDAIDGVISGLDDPNTTFLTAEEWENLRIRTEGEYAGLGIEIGVRNRWVTVITPLPGTPAERAGLRAGDRIIEVAGQSTEGWNVDQAARAIRGPRGSPIEIKVLRPGVDEPIPFRMVREQVQVHSVPFHLEVSDGIGYVPLRAFSESSVEEVRDALTALRNEGATGLVLDLRYNPGGLLESGVAIADLFLPRNVPVVETRGRVANSNQVLNSRGGETYSGRPLVVLVNDFSASASEIVAGALQDHDRALVVGTPTFGKGSVQTLFPLSGGNVLKLTTGLWYTPSGRSIQKDAGSEPDPSEVDEVAGLGAGTRSVTGELVQRPDSTSRQAFQTRGGRTVYGGGGITPDLVIYPDTLTQAEQRSFRELVRSSVFGETLFNFAVRHVRENPNITTDFRVTDAVRRQFFTALREAGATIEWDVVSQAGRFLDYQLETEMAAQKWGPEQEFRHGMRYDRPLQEAIDLLRQASSPSELFTAAGRRNGQRPGGNGGRN
ncbi:MAG: S41 family peptidase [Gemmatimonadetes bacterium]|nr:S41 family peptidase [Gemmatimonadota bacterium]